MRIVVTAPGRSGPRHLLVTAPEGARVDELRAELDPGTSPPTRGAGEPLRHGYAVEAPGGRSAAGSAPVRLVVVSGPDAGGSVELSPGRWVSVGRASTCDLRVEDPTLSREHVRVRHERDGVVVEDLGSTNGLAWDAAARDDSKVGRSGDPVEASTALPWPPGATLKVGATRLTLVLEPMPPAAGRDHAGRFRVTPWPRHVPEAELVQLTSPEAPRRREVRAPSAWAWALPLVAALVLAVLLRMPTVILFGLMAPVMVLGHHLGERRAARLDHASALDRHAAAREELASAATRALTHELVVLRDRDPGILGANAALLPRPTASLWARSGEPPTVVLGEGGSPARVEVDGHALRHEAAPVTLDLSQPVAVVGPPHLRAGAVRGWLLQLACQHAPSDLALLVDPATPPGPGWDLLAWLPHTRPGPTAHTRLGLRWAQADGLLLVDDVRDAPPGVTQVLLDTGTSALLRRPGRPDVPFRPTLVGLPVARSLARRLAPLDHDDRGTGPRGPVRLGDLTPWPTDGAGVRAGWHGPGADLSVPVGTDDAGAAVVVDLARDGPHALVAGTTGSGKSELLRTLVTGLALRNPPSRLSMLLIDYKGGSSLAECAQLPHTTGLVTDLDPHLGARVLVSLRAELDRRERVLARAGARDVRDYTGRDLPRLVVVVDEFRVLAEELPDFLGGLVRLAAVGRSLGVHLVLATQRPAGVVSADLRANVNLRIALRVRDAADSVDVLEVPDAASLPEGQPGRGLLRTGATPPRPLQVAPVGPGTTATEEPGWRVEEVEDVWNGWERLRSSAAGLDSGLGTLPGLLARVAREDDARPLSVWQPPLEDVLPSRGDGSWALSDRPELQRHEPLTWDGRSHIGVVGAARTGRTTAVRSLVAGAGPLWLYVLDPARGLERSAVRQHPGLRAWVGPHDPAHAVRVLEVVNELIDDRLARGVTPDDRRVVTVVDGWDRFVEAYGDAGHGRARELALRVLRDGTGAGVVVLVTGDRSLLTGTLSSELPQLWALRLHDPGDLALAGLRPHQVPAHQPPGRLVRTRDALVAQVLLPDDSTGVLSAPEGCPPPRVVSLPTAPPDLDAWAVGGDEGGALDPPPGPFVVVGPPGSGVTTALSTIAAHCPGEVLRVGPGQGQEEVAAALAGFTGTVLVDDAHLLAGSRTEDLVLGWAERPCGRLLVGAELEASAALFRGLVPHTARHRCGLVLQPGTPTHGALLGVRLPVGDRSVPGRGVLVDRGRCTRVQVVPVSPPRGRPSAGVDPGAP